MKKHLWKICLFISLAFILEACAPSRESEESCEFVQNSFGQRVSWNSKVPVKVFIHESVPQEFFGAIEAAMKKWDNALASRPLFVLGGIVNGPNHPVQDDATIIYWKEDWTGDKVGEQARTTVFWKENQIKEADIQVNARDFHFAWQEGPVNGAVDIESLLVHELGHVLGLAHSKGPASVMATRLSSGTLRRVPSKTDLDSLRCEY